MLGTIIKHLRLRNIKRCTNAEYEGISITNINWGGEEKKEVFTRITIDALKMIEQYDSLVFRRQISRISYIINEIVPLTTAIYNPSIRCISIDFDQYDVSPDSEYYEWHTAQVATVLVHESTHAYLVDRGIPHTKQNAFRVEKICKRQEHRFAKRLPKGRFDYAGDLVQPINKEYFRKFVQPSPYTLLKDGLQNTFTVRKIRVYRR